MPKFIFYSFAFIFLLSLLGETDDHAHNKHLKETTAAMAFTQPSDTTGSYEIQRSEKEWRDMLSRSEYRILRNAGTEIPFTNEYWNHKEEGIYYCRGCGQPLYSSETKYRSGTGWPSFWEPIRNDVIQEKEDNSLWMTRTETVCSRCGSHLGHVFEDGPDPTGLRYCMNSKALLFKEMDLEEVDVEELQPIEVD